MDLSADLVDNRGLFTDHYLEEVLGDRPGVENLVEDADDALEQAKGKYEEKKSELAEGTNEEQTVKRFITPILDEVLGWSSIVRQTVQGEGESYGEPDYALFSDSEVRDEASARASGGEYDRAFRNATALAEAKRWHLSLKEGGKSVSDDRAPSEGAPGAQVFRYFQWTGVSWGILTNGNKWRLYTSRVPSPADTYLELNLEKILEQPHGPEEDPTEARSAFRLFYLLFHAESFREDPTLGKPFIDAVFEESIDRGRELENELTERVFDKVFVTLATGFFEDWSGGEDKVPSGEVLDSIYRATLRLLYRLLFLLYAEDRGLLPVHDRKGYYQYSLSKIAKDAREEIHEGQVIIGDDLWGELQYLFGEIISTGNSELNVPTYNGDLFDVGSSENAWLDQHTVPDKRLAPALTDLTLVNPDDPDSRGVDYKALDVRQLGSIYEGLLEHRLRYAEEDTALVKENDTEVYKPHSALSSSESPSRVVEEGELYLETDKSERKKTGSYYTPHYIVEYIVENTLGPVLDERIEQFENLVEEIGEIEADQPPSDTDTEPDTRDLRRQARDALLSIRVCDPAMGSGHFLVHAVDYMTNRIGAVALNRGLEINPVREILDEMREEILESLDDQDVKLSNVEDQLDDFTLLRRIVMKRCIYGVDVHRMAVELSQLSLWLRSFTIGAPLSFLKHHLKQGNSLIGTTTDELREALSKDEKKQLEAFGQRLSDRLKKITEQAQGIIQLSDATFDQVKESDKRFREYENESLPLKRVLDLWTSRQFGNEDAEKALNQAPGHVLDVFQSQADPRDEEQRKVFEAAIDQSEERSFFHWELEFPEVYLSKTGEERRAGFDAVIGNPPYSFGRDWGELPEKDYFSGEYRCAQYQIDLYHLFMETGLNLARQEGFVSLIVPDVWTHAIYSGDLRKLYLDSTHLQTILGLPSDVFEDATVDTIVFCGRKGSTEDDLETQVYQLEGPGGEPEYFFSIEQETFAENETNKIDFWTRPAIRTLASKTRKESVQLADICETTRGINAYDRHQGQSKETIENREYHADHQVDDSFSPLMMGKNASRHHNGWEGQHWIQYGEWLAAPREERVFTQPKLLTRKLLSGGRIVCLVDEDEFYVDQQLYVGIQPEEEYGLYYLCAVVNSTFMSFYYLQTNREEGVEFPQMTVTAHDNLPIREIEFTLSEGEREDRADALIDQYETTWEKSARPDDNAILDAVENCLSADPERTGVLHDLLSRLACKMEGLKEKRQTFNLDITDHIPKNPSEDQGFGLRDVSRYQPAEDITDTLITDKTDERTKLHISRLIAERFSAADGNYKVKIQVIARFKPEGERESWPNSVPESAEPDQYNYLKTHPIDVCTLHGCDEIESGLIVHWLKALNDTDSGFSDFREDAGKTISLLDRLDSLRIPNPSDEVTEKAVSSFLSNFKRAEELDEQIAFTDQLIDQVVYKLYGLTEDEIGVVEQAV